MCCMWSSCFVINHLLSITVVCTDEENSVNILYCIYSLANKLINLLYSLDCCWDNTCMTNHIRISEVDNNNIIFVRLDSLN